MFLSFLARLRKGSRALRQGSYRMGIAFSRPDGREGYDSRADLAFRVRIDGSSVGDRDFLLLVNLSYEAVRFAVELPDAGTLWKRLVDTAYWAEAEDNAWTIPDALPIGGEYEAKACSIVLLAAS
jgi:glycogen operon protein